jgi:hypothetical protein
VTSTTWTRRGATEADAVAIRFAPSVHGIGGWGFVPARLLQFLMR